jgi:hypothetical protein
VHHKPCKKLFLWSELACHISSAGKDTMAPMNWHSYADATKNFLTAFHFQKIKSMEVSKMISVIAMKSKENSSTCIGVLILVRFLIQLLFCSFLVTDLLLNLANSKRLGASSIGAAPHSHLASQNGVALPFPSWIQVEETNKCLSIGSTTLRRFFQGLSFSSHWCQSHRSLKTLLNLLRSLIPRPPSFFGLVHIYQFIKQ